LSDEVEVDVGIEWGRIEKDEPDVYAQFGLNQGMISLAFDSGILDM